MGVTRERVRQRSEHALEIIQSREEWQRLKEYSLDDSHSFADFVEYLIAPHKKRAFVNKEEKDSRKRKSSITKARYSRSLTRYELEDLLIDDQARYLEEIGLQPALAKIEEKKVRSQLSS